MKNYTPSVKNNNQIKDDILQELKAFLYRVEKGRYNSNIDKETIRGVYESLHEAYENLDGTIFTGDEDLAKVNAKIEENIGIVKKRWSKIIRIGLSNQLKIYSIILIRLEHWETGV